MSEAADCLAANIETVSGQVRSDNDPFERFFEHVAV
jgi:hypothetical protein